MGLVVLPVAVVDVTVSVDEAPAAVCLVVLPESFVEGAVNPNLNALAVLLVSDPLALVLSTVF